MNTYEQIAVWYLRLNGYFTMPNFIAHGDNDTRSEVDVLGVRFPHSCEFEDDKTRLNIPAGKIDVVLSEATKGRCKLNGPWKKKEPSDALGYVLRRVGLFDSQPSVDGATSDLYRARKYENEKLAVRIVCFGSKPNGKLKGVTQILWPDVISFIRQRFCAYKEKKKDHKYWDSFGIYLWDKLTAGDQQELSVDDIVEGWRLKFPCWPLQNP